MSRARELAGFATATAPVQNLSVGIVTATSYAGDGSALSGVGVPGVSTTVHAGFNDVTISGFGTITDVGAASITATKQTTTEHSRVTGIATINTVVVATALTSADSVKSYWGTGGDLQIYHDGSNSYINESGTGDLYIRGGTSVRITDLSDNKMFLGQDGGEAQLYYDGLQKLATKTNGTEVSGILTATSLSGRHGNIEAVTKSTGYTLVSGDEGKMIISDSAVTVPQDIFSAGDVITVVNSSGSSFNIIKGTGINLYTIGSSTNATTTLAEKGIAIITCFAGNDFIVGGGGVS